MQRTKLGEYAVSFNYGYGGFLANDPLVLTDEQARGVVGKSWTSAAPILDILISYHRANTNQQHPLERTPTNFVVPEKIDRLEVALRRLH